MDHRTDTQLVDEALARFLDEPTWASRLLTATAGDLEATPDETLNPAILCRALNSAMDRIFAGLPEEVTTEAAAIACDALPYSFPLDTAGTYAAALRHTAQEL